MQEVLSDMSGNGSGDIHVHLYLDRKEIHEEVVKQDKQYYQRTGKSAFAHQ
jgi:hypothetical protein